MEVRHHVINLSDHSNYNLAFVSLTLLHVFIMLSRKCGYLSTCTTELIIHVLIIRLNNEIHVFVVRTFDYYLVFKSQEQTETKFDFQQYMIHEVYLGIILHVVYVVIKLTLLLPTQHPFINKMNIYSVKCTCMKKTLYLAAKIQSYLLQLQKFKQIFKNGIKTQITRINL